MKKQKIKDNLFGITYAVIIILVQIGILIPITSSIARKVKKNHEDPVNGYFRIKGIPNLVWMHVQDGYGVFINEYVVTETGQHVNLVDILSKYYWFIDNRFNKVRSSKLNNQELSRCIGSVIRYGNIKRRLPQSVEVHHKWKRWCNTQHTITTVCKKYHKWYHDNVGTRKSHQLGVFIENQSSAFYWFSRIAKKDSKYMNIPM